MLVSFGFFVKLSAVGRLVPKALKPDVRESGVGSGYISLELNFEKISCRYSRGIVRAQSPERTEGGCPTGTYRCDMTQKGNHSDSLYCKGPS